MIPYELLINLTDKFQFIRQLLSYALKNIDIQCGGAGFGPSTHYYGIFYSADDNLCTIDVAGPRDKLVEHGEGYLYQEKSGDNRYYIEQLGNHFYYCEAHF